MHTKTESNPYAAPSEPTQFRGLSPDTEFLVSGECVLGGEAISLPSVCIATGQTGELNQEESNLKWVPGWMSNIRIILTIIGVPMVLSYFGRGFDALPGGQFTWAQLAPHLIVLSIVGLTVLSWILVWRNTYVVKITWFVNVRKSDSESRIQRIWRILSAAFLILGVALMVIGTSYQLHQAILFAIVLIIVAGLSTLTGRGKTQPKFIGRHEGLNVVMLSRPFVDRVQLMIESQSD